MRKNQNFSIPGRNFATTGENASSKSRNKISKDDANKYFSYRPSWFNNSSFRLSNTPTFEIVEKEIDEYFDDEKRTSNAG